MKLLFILLFVCNTYYGSATAPYDSVGKRGEKTFINLLTKSIERDSYEKRNRSRAERFLQLGILYTENGLYKESVECFQKADSLYALIGDLDYRSYVWVRLYNSYCVIGDKVQYDIIRKKLVSIYEDEKIGNTEISLIVASQVGKFYEEDGIYDKALSAYTNSLKTNISCYGECSPQIYPICYELASLCLKMGDMKGASEYIQCLKKICDSHSQDREMYIYYILLKTETFRQLGNIGEALSILEGAQTAIDRIHNAELNALFYSTLGGLYAEIGEFEQALMFEKQALIQCEKSKGTVSVQYAHILLNLGEYYSIENKASEALLSIKKAVEIIRSKYGTDHPEYYTCIRKLAAIYSNIDKCKSNELLKECLFLSKKLFGENSIEYADLLLYSVDLSKEPSQEDLNTVCKGLEIRKNIGRDYDQFYLSFLNWYSTLLFVKQDWNSLLKVSTEILKSTKEYISINVQRLSSTQREKFWNTVKTSLDGLESYVINYSHYSVEHGDFSLIDDFGKIAYNSRLIKKGVLLESNRKLSELISTKKDSVVTQICSRIDFLKHRLTSPDNNSKGFLSLKNQLHSLERELIQRVAPNGEFMDFLSINWNDVQSTLTSDEIAIEFFSNKVQDKIQYGAVLLSHNTNPIAIPLFCEDELEKFAKTDETSYDYDNPGLYRTIWSAIETFSEVHKAKTIYFSADNILNTIAIENLLDQDGKRVCDKCRLYRLSSTREIIFKHHRNSNKTTAILYGGLNYDAPLDSIVENAYKSSIDVSSKQKQQSYVRSLRGAYNYLPGTFDEIKHISRIIKGYHTELRSGNIGSEKSFKALSGCSPAILHIATHGFFYKPNEIEEKLFEEPAKYNFLNIANLNAPSIETQAMLGSGILLSGANSTLKGISIPDSIPDGILTAAEVSDLDLRDTDLVVLSACETGLGISTEEGVFGLQRGFKLAGVRSVLMSLWKVDDKVTSKLMSFFYENIAKGVSKLQSLRDAQKKVRDDSQTSNPYYWAGFVLLDGLN